MLRQQPFMFSQENTSYLHTHHPRTNPYPPPYYGYVKTFFLGWNVYEYIFFTLSLIVPTVVGLIVGSGFVVIVASTSLLLAEFFVARAKLAGNFLRIIGLIFYIWAALLAGLWGEAIYSILFIFPITIYAIFHWKSNSRKDPEKGVVISIKTPKLKEILPLIILLIAIGFGLYYLLVFLQSEQIIASTITAVLAIASAYFLARRSSLGMVIDTLHELALLTLWALVASTNQTKAIVVIIVPIMCIVNNIYGMINWLQLRRKQAKSLDKHDEI